MTSCTILITEPYEFVAKIHDRMSVILDPEQYDAWLSPATTPEDAKAMVHPYSAI